MKILIEQLDYEVLTLEKLLPSSYFTYKKDGKASINWVGYYNNFETNETVVLLPKIFIDEQNQKIFQTIAAQELSEQNALDVLRLHQKSQADIHFVYRFALVFYLSLRELQVRNPETSIIENVATKNIVSNLAHTDVSELDLIFSLLRFYQAHKDLILFKQKETEKQHFQKTNWAKTIRKHLPLVQENNPIYFETHQKQRNADNENDLLRIFFSVLQRFKTQYGFNIRIENAVIEKDTADFDRKALRTLKSIRHQYFHDKFKKLLGLLMAYFEKREGANAKEGKEEFVLCRDYNIVFEDMIDKLLSDKDLPKSLKQNLDGKIIDHIFHYESFFQSDSIFYIGDSKYYKESTAYSKNSIYKQHTYAKNIIQYNVNLFQEKANWQHGRYRDDLTEGYNITPNFFIQGYINHQNITDSQSHFKFDETQDPKINAHFPNRIFDRDTLLVYHFKINFLFVLQSYIEKDQNKTRTFRNSAKEIIKQQVWKHLQERYDFFVLQPENIDLFVHEHFKILNGKIYRTSQMTNTLILGLEKNDKESETLLEAYKEILASKTSIINH